MNERLGRLGWLRRSGENDEAEAVDGSFTALRLFAADLLLTAGLQASIGLLRSRSKEPRLASRPIAIADADGPLTRTLLYLPAVIGPVAAAAQATHALNPTDRTYTMVRVLNGIVIGAGAAGLADSIAGAARGQRDFSFTPLLFGYLGVLGVLLDREESDVREEAENLRRRASIVERWVPRRKTKVQKIVVHV